MIKTIKGVKRIARKFSVTGAYPIRFNKILNLLGQEITVKSIYDTIYIEYRLDNIKLIDSGEPDYLKGTVMVRLPISKEELINKILKQFKHCYLHELAENICIKGQQYKCPHKYGEYLWDIEL